MFKNNTLLDNNQRQAQAAIRSANQSMVKEKIFPKLETIEQLLELVPKRIYKEPYNFNIKKMELEKMAREQEVSEQEIKQLPQIVLSDIDFPQEEDFQKEMSVQAITQREVANAMPFVSEDLIIQSGRSLNELIEIKNSFILPPDIQQKYVFNSTPLTRQDVLFRQLIQPANFIKQRLDSKNQVISQFLFKESLKQFTVSAQNDFFLSFDQIPTKKDMEKRAELIADLYVKYNLRDAQQRVVEDRLEQKKFENEKLIKMEMAKKMEEGQITEKTLQEQLKMKREQEKAAAAAAESARKKQEEELKQQQSQFDGKQKITSNPVHVAVAPVQHKNSIQEDQSEENQQFSQRKGSNQSNSASVQQFNTKRQGSVPIVEKNQEMQPEEQEEPEGIRKLREMAKENERRHFELIQEQMQHIEQYFQEIKEYINHKIFEDYENNNLEQAIEDKKELEHLEYEKDHLRDPDTFLRTLLIYKMHNDI